ncbi:ABC transporter permease [Streptomyces durbertensis]|uniref:ABC transporter permease n=1 Tax=Streptomyces durbertensis TaxID=2448886 RepID=A0ABR6EL27_9ACTN|nr:ABC transporter permease [Streptomyces durbertensis]MBB1246024.1 ABC transporter permease [Streptomyces durbertensis]
MIRFLLRRVLGATVILLVISAVTFLLFYSIPRDPARLACGKTCDPESLAMIRASLGVDRPVPVQFWEYLVGIFAGRDFAAGPCPAPCLGYSFRDQSPVLETILDRVPTTASLALGGAVVFLTVGLALGMIAARNQGNVVDKGLSSLSLVMSSMQIYLVGPLVLAVFVYHLQLLPSPRYVALTEDPVGWFKGLLVPWLVMSIIFTAAYTRMARSTLVEQLREDHVRTARAKGMSGRTVFFRHAWRGSLIPIVTILGVDLGSLFGGAMVTEFTFALPGLGRLAVNSVTQTDLPMLMGVMLFAAAMIIAFNIVVDAVYAWIDPRIRLS